MSVDRLSQMVNAIKNAAMAKKHAIEVFHSNECEATAKVLKSAGFLSEVKVFKPKGAAYKMIGIELAFDENLPVLTDAQRISKPGRRDYKGHKELHKIAGGFGIAVVSTSRGIMAGEEAKKKKLGGEVICEVR